MKYRLFSVLMILAMVASLCAVAIVAPASGDVVSSPTVTTTSPAAGAAAGYTVVFTTGGTGALTALVDEVYLTFPAGTDLPSSLSYTNVLVSTSGTAAMNVESGGVSVSGQTVTVRMPMSAANNDPVTITIAQGEGIKNPALSREPASGGDGQGTSGYTIGVKTSNAFDSTSVASTPYFIFNWVQCIPMAAAKGGPLTVVGGGFLPGSSVALAAVGGAQGAGTVEADGTFSIMAFAAGLAAPVIVTDGSGRSALTAALSVLPGLILVPTSGNIGSQVVLKGYDFAGTPAGVAITIGGISVASGVTFIDLDNDGTVDDFAFATNIPIGLAGGDKIVKVISGGGGTGSPSASATVTVANHAVTVDPASGAAGSTIVLTGAGWPPSCTTGGVDVFAPGLFSFAYSASTQAVIGDGAVETDGTGAFTETATIPANATPGLTAIVCIFGGPSGQSLWLTSPLLPTR